MCFSTCTETSALQWREKLPLAPFKHTFGSFIMRTQQSFSGVHKWTVIRRSFDFIEEKKTVCFYLKIWCTVQFGRVANLKRSSRTFKSTEQNLFAFFCSPVTIGGTCTWLESRFTLRKFYFHWWFHHAYFASQTETCSVTVRTFLLVKLEMIVVVCHFNRFMHSKFKMFRWM